MRQLLLACENNLLTLDLDNGDVVFFCETAGAPSAVAVSDNGHLVAYVLRDSSAIYVLCGSIKTHTTLLGHEEKVDAIALCSDCQTLISTGSDHTIRFWDTSTGTERQSLPPLKAVGRRVCAIHGTNLAGIVEYDGDAPAPVRLFELERPLEIGVVKFPIEDISRIAASNSGRMVACVSSAIYKLADGYSFAIALIDVITEGVTMC